MSQGSSNSSDHEPDLSSESTADQDRLRELLFLRDLQFGFLPEQCEDEFAKCFERFATDEAFAWKCFKLALGSRNEDLIRVLLDHLVVDRSNFHNANCTFIDTLLLEAVEMNDLESLESILSWRDAKSRQLGLTDVDKRLLKLQKAVRTFYKNMIKY